MPSIVQVGFVALTIASTAFGRLQMRAPFANTTSLYPTGYVPTGYVPTGYVPTGYVPTGGSTSSSTSAPYGNSTTPTLPPTSPPSPPTTTPPTTTGRFTTSVIYTTVVETITACPPQVTKCPYGEIVTKTIPISTTICPITEGSQPVVTVVPVPPQSITSTIIVTNVQTITGPSGEQGVTSKIYTSVVTYPYTEVYPPHGGAQTTPSAPYPTGGPGSSAPIGTGTGTGAYKPTTVPYKPDGVLTLSAVSPPQPTYTPPPLSQSAAGRFEVTGVLALVLASTLALLW